MVVKQLTINQVMYSEADQIKHIINDARSVVVVQADNPDADSLGSALALEHILGDQDKEVSLYCAVDMPGYLHYLSGWDRVQKDLPNNFDASIIVDASTMTLLEKLSQSGQQGWLASKPCVVLDHHENVDNLIPFSTVNLTDHKRSSAGELIYVLSKQLGWPINLEAQACLMTCILGDTQGLTNQLTSAETYRIIADMVEAGVDRPELEEKRREYSKMPPEIFRYKAELIKRTEFSDNGQLAIVVITQSEINEFSPLYNPGPLVQPDMLQTIGVRMAIVLKAYDDGKVTAAIRCNPGAGLAAKLADHFGGGGHAFASGFKTTGRNIADIKADCLSYAAELFNKLGETS